MREYTDRDSVLNYLLLTVDDSFSTQIDAWIQEMTAYIEKETGRVFLADENSSDRLFEVRGRDSEDIGRGTRTPNDVIIDDAVDVVSVKLIDSDDSETEISRNKIKTYPANSTPITRLQVISDATTQLSVGFQNIKVNAKWGYSEDVPLDIKFACTVLTAGVIQHSQKGAGDLQSISLGGAYNATFANKEQINDFKKTKEILDRYRKWL